MNIIKTGAESKLQMSDLIFTKICFERNENEMGQGLSFGVERHVEKAEDGTHDVILSINLNDDNSAINIEIVAVGTFILTDDDGFTPERRDAIMNNNTVAIMFPYIRSQLTLLTSQPNFPPIVLPAMNIIEMLNMQNNI